ncbi:hypothetical protein [Bradyrhizobium macuxiense]|uniref:hypothetical protein n=1 Tax=Bradyrhizobium macuxiense TaxID=1755647 RepID=UPI00142EA0F9|nr:hypothetical protein [Bradyrhizobium macuxiense]
MIENARRKVIVFTHHKMIVFAMRKVIVFIKHEMIVHAQQNQIGTAPNRQSLEQAPWPQPMKN